ncbi:MAG: hypothetical protein LKG90_07610, partial [Lachnospiraceae bacterium]|nr:hypothetical protein [Lachnospiraceae bacterium]MCI1367760.1 hypothetical protein [Lachnospiraceae bacterium]MCI1391290.1 hypothetical protein [Lachnospiraceae bacterium]MCI1422151.1 hypothetical protein [Lachnospiraceae bacterium]MCI1444103.1 hypothetical protein [Lachnospiraceae bacterium]
AIYRPTARICTEDDLLKLDFGLQMFQKMEVTASNWKYEFQPTAGSGRLTAADSFHGRSDCHSFRGRRRQLIIF